MPRGHGEANSGLFLEGDYLSSKVDPGRPRPNGEGSYPDRFIVSVLAGEDSVFRVEYRDAAAAARALGIEAFDTLERGTQLRLAVGVRAAKGYAFYFGRGQGDE